MTPNMQDIIDITLKNRASRVADGLSLNELFYGDTIKWVDRPFSYKIRWHFAMILGRIGDACGVLIGRYHVGDDY